MAEHVFLLVISLPLATILLVFAMRYGSMVLKARAENINKASQTQIVDSLADVRLRLAEIERILKEVG